MKKEKNILKQVILGAWNSTNLFLFFHVFCIRNMNIKVDKMYKFLKVAGALEI